MGRNVMGRNEWLQKETKKGFQTIHQNFVKHELKGMLKYKGLKSSSTYTSITDVRKNSD
jgi:uncharacterized protein YehS (DUF1456 family)